jgi:hypothetical protein
MHIEYWWESQKEDQDAGGWIILYLERVRMGWYGLH